MTRKENKNDEEMSFKDFLSSFGGSKSAPEKRVECYMYEGFIQYVVMYLLFSHLKNHTKDERKEIVSFITNNWKTSIRKTIEPFIQKHTEMMETPTGKMIKKMFDCDDGEKLRIKINKLIKNVEKMIGEQMSSAIECS